MDQKIKAIIIDDETDYGLFIIIITGVAGLIVGLLIGKYAKL
jgi:hypothetical protein